MKKPPHTDFPTHKFSGNFEIYQWFPILTGVTKIGCEFYKKPRRVENCGQAVISTITQLILNSPRWSRIFPGRNSKFSYQIRIIDHTYFEERLKFVIFINPRAKHNRFKTGNQNIVLIYI